MNQGIFSGKIISWYEENKRHLPWRDTTDPYKIWLSEVILQQTRVAQGLPYYIKFVENFPDVASLARAPEDKVLRLWQGLGYYSRARNLHACAKQVHTQLGGKFPSTYEKLKELPGIGSYTAAAIASIAFNEPVAVVDGNVFRVLSRVFGIDKDIASNEGKNFFFAKANELIHTTQPALFNQAMMEFGALHCTPQNPKCASCTFARSCVANIQSLQQVLPVKSKKLKIRKRFFTYFVLEMNGKLLMRKREAGDIWNGLYDFMLEETAKQLKPDALIKKHAVLSRLKTDAVSKVYKHLLSHQQLMVQFVHIKLKSEKDSGKLLKEVNGKFYSKKQVAELPKPILITRYVEETGFLA